MFPSVGIIVIGWTVLASALPAPASAAVFSAASTVQDETPVSADDARRALVAGRVEMENWTALLPDEVSPDSGNVRTWVNGALVTDRTVGQPAADAEEFGALYKKGDWWGNFLECMNGAGVSSWLVSAISVACSTICIITAGAGCVACLAAAAAGTGGAVGACITVASNHT